MSILSQMQTDPLMQMGLGMLGQSGPTRAPVGFGAAFGAGMNQGLENLQRGQQAQFQNQQMEFQGQQMQQQQAQQQAFQEQAPGMLAQMGVPQEQIPGIMALGPEQVMGMINQPPQETFSQVPGGQISSLTGRRYEDPTLPDAPALPSASTDLGKLQQDLNNGLITQEQYNQQAELLSQPEAENLTAGQRLAAGFAQRTQAANATITELGEGFTGVLSRTAGIFPQGWHSEDRQRFDQATEDFINATLRRESGAAIAPSEFISANSQYIPQPGDKEEVLEQKRINRETVSLSMQLEAGGAYTELKEAVGALTFQPVPASHAEGTRATDSQGRTIIVVNGMWELE